MQHSSKPLSRRRILQTGSLLSLGMGLTRVVGLLVTSYFSGSGTVRGQSFLDKSVDHAALPKVPQEFQITLLAREPLLRQPCLMALSMQEPVATGTTTPMAAGTKTPASRPTDPTSVKGDFSVGQQQDRLRISLSEKPIVDFVFRDEKIRRPYFANARLANGLQVTRNHPPINGVDAVDHDTMHPGIWIGFGDISGQDFWRNKGAMEHVRFVSAPKSDGGRLRFASECRLKTSNGEPLCMLTNQFTLAARPNGWLLVWSAEFRADQNDFSFGDQEEMGFGARVATPFTENNGGLLRSSTGKRTATETWGQPAAWCDYSGSGERAGGILLMASPGNFRESWWHNRDYGVFVANPFGREAMKQGGRSTVTVAKGEALKLTFGALIHDHREFDPQSEFKTFEEIQTVDFMIPTDQ